MLRTFSSDKRVAVNRINQMSPDEFYQHIQAPAHAGAALFVEGDHRLPGDVAVTIHPVESAAERGRFVSGAVPVRDFFSFFVISLLIRKTAQKVKFTVDKSLRSFNKLPVTFLLLRAL